MRRLLFYWRLFRVFSRRFPLHSISEPDWRRWTEADGQQLAAFLNSQTGLKFVHMCEWMEQYQNREAVLTEKAGEYHRGWAGGWHAAFSWWFGLSAKSWPLNDDKHKSAVAGADSELEQRLAP